MNRSEMDHLDALLMLAADTLGDIEATRIAAGNRIGALDRDKAITEGREVERAVALHAALQALEHQAELDVGRIVRKHYLGAYVAASVGIGEKQGGRLVAAIGNPRVKPAVVDRDGNVIEPERLRRGVAELWAYAGYHVIDGHAPRRQKGQRANWNPDAKMRAFLCAESAIKHGHSPYRPVYDAARAKHAAAVHNAPCARCGPAGKPAAAGSALSDGHKHARALREVAKAILRDLFIAAPIPSDWEDLSVAA